MVCGFLGCFYAILREQSACSGDDARRPSNDEGIGRMLCTSIPTWQAADEKKNI